MARKWWPLKSNSEALHRGGSGWLILSVLLLILASLRFAYNMALFSVPLSDIVMGALK
jgi:hypothetical protein